MPPSNPIAEIVAWIGKGAIMLRHRSEGDLPQAVGADPAIPRARAQGSIPTLKMPTATGWHGGRLPVAADGLRVIAYATGLDHPRWIEVLPNGDVCVAEALQLERKPGSLFDLAMVSTLKRAAAIGKSANRITLLRDSDGDGVAEFREVFVENQRQPFGMAMVDGTFYIGNTDALVSFAYEDGATRLTGEPVHLASFKPGGHWTRSLLVSPDRSKLYVGVGSMTNIADGGMEIEQGRACIYEFERASGRLRVFATGLRNPVGMAWEPRSETLWTVVNERDGLGDETPPDYLTSVRDGGFYGWPYCYWGRTIDDRVPQDASMVATALQPDYALGGHTASLGLCWHPAGTLPGFGDGMIIGQHGSWNRSTLRGYRVVFVPFDNGSPAGPPRDVLSGFLSDDETKAWGRPVGVALHKDGALLVADDVGNTIWRVTAG